MTTAQALALRCQIAPAAAAGQTNIEIAAALGCHPVTAGKWRRRFDRHRLDGLSDAPRPGAPRTIGEGQVEGVIVKTLEQQPRNATHWSTRSMAAELGMSQTAISRTGVPSGSNRTSSSGSGCRPTRSSSTRCATSPSSISTHPRRQSRSAWASRRRSRSSTAPRRLGRCARRPPPPDPRLRTTRRH